MRHTLATTAALLLLAQSAMADVALDSDADALWAESTEAHPRTMAAPAPHPLPCVRDTDPASDEVVVLQDLSTSYQYFTTKPVPSPYKGGVASGCRTLVPSTPHTYVDRQRHDQTQGARLSPPSGTTHEVAPP